MSEKTFTIQNTRIPNSSTRVIVLLDDPFNAFRTKIMKGKGINHPLNKSILMKYTKGVSEFRIVDNESLSNFKDKNVKIINVFVVSSLYLSFMFAQTLRKRKFNMLSKLNEKLRKERFETYSSVINEKRKMRAVVEGQSTPFKLPNSCLVAEAGKLNELTKSLSIYESNVKNLNESFTGKQMKTASVLQSKLCNDYDHNMNCNACSKNIIGLRFKCSVSNNFNICEECRTKPEYQQNFFIEIENSKHFEAEDEMMNNSFDDKAISSPQESEKTLEIFHFIAINLSEEKKHVLVIPYTTSLEDISMALDEEQEEIPGLKLKFKKGPLGNSIKIDFGVENPEMKVYKIKTRFLSHYQPIDQKPVIIMVKISNSSNS